MDAVAVGAAEQEEFRFGPHVEGPASFFESREDAPQSPPRVAFKRLPGRSVDVAEHPGTAQFRIRPGEYRVAVRIQPEVHVAFLDAGETLHRGSIEPHSIGKR